MKRLRLEMVCFLRSHGFDCTDAVEPHQPFFLPVWHALAPWTADVDVHLPRILVDGVPTGIESPIFPSGVWDSVNPEGVNDCCDVDPTNLSVHLEPWGPASDDLALRQQLLQKDIDPGV